jgi:hypothetical protein
MLDILRDEYSDKVDAKLTSVKAEADKEAKKSK